MVPSLRRLLVVLLALLGILAWRSAAPTPAASASAITTLFPGSLSGSATAAPGHADALFTTLANQATMSIDIALYDFNRATVRDALVGAKGRGVAVRVVGDNKDAVDPSYKPFYDSLTATGISVVTDTKSSLMHNKFAVFDNSVTWTGSANFSDTGFTLNGENIVVITDTVVAGIYQTEFEEMFGGKFSNDKMDNTAHSATVDGAPVEIAFAPTDGVENRIVSAVNTANTSVHVAMFTFTNDAISAALIAAHSRGVAVEVLLDQYEAGVVGGERDRLCAGGVTVRVENFAGKLHDKYAVVDASTTSDPLITTGSTNWTANAVESNDENLLIVHDAVLASAFATDFSRMRAAIGPNAITCNVGAVTTPTVARYLPLVQKDGLPDLTIIGMTISLEQPCISPLQLSIRVTVANTGVAAAGPFVVVVNGVQQTVSMGLGAGQQITQWFPGYIASGPNTAIVDVTHLVAESDENNNQLSEQLPLPTPVDCPPPPSRTPTATPPMGGSATITFAGSVWAQHHAAWYRWGAAPAGESYGRFAFGIGHRADTPGATTARSAGARQMLLAGHGRGRGLDQFARALRGGPGD